MVEAVQLVVMVQRPWQQVPVVLKVRKPPRTGARPLPAPTRQ